MTTDTTTSDTVNHAEAPVLECDLIMKGGITSGVIYPGVVSRLAGVYRLRSIGGASAGAIAASAAAVAESARATGGFERLSNLPGMLSSNSPAGGSLLFRLFQPQEGTAGIFRMLTAGLGRSGPGRAFAIGRATLAAVPGWTVAGTLPGLALLVVVLGSDGVRRWVGVVLALGVAVLGAVLAAAVGVVRRLASRVPANGYGLCSGMPGARPKGATALTPWLHETLQWLAGRGADDAPVTFGDLARADVELNVMTTNLTRHQPVAMPWAGREYFFDPAKWRLLFPEPVVAWLEKNPPASSDGRQFRTDLRRAQALPLLPLPAPENLPIVVATRMSLSFPLLISAVPLLAVDYDLPANVQAAEAAQEWRSTHPEGTVEQARDEVPAPVLGVNWFSDGGICSNLPVHFFDSPLPLRPTFAIDLAPFPAGRKRSGNEADNSYLPTVNQGGAHRRWTGWPVEGLSALTGFGRSIIDTARAWVDEAQLVMPGYRDRIVTIYQDDTEGGMNLSMPPEVLTNLTHRGEGAADKLILRFAGTQPGHVPGPGWENHRWIRFRTATSGLEEWLGTFAGGYAHPDPAGTSYADLAGPGAHDPLPSYEMKTQKQRTVVNERTGALLDLTERWADAPSDAFSQGGPSPRPILRLVPREAASRLRGPQGL